VLQPFFAPAFPLEFFPVGQTPQTLDQQAPVDQESPAGLVAAESVQQCDGLPAPQSEQAFDDGAVYHRHVERFQLRCDLRNMQ
jgi:hypothetical protein